MGNISESYGVSDRRPSDEDTSRGASARLRQRLKARRSHLGVNHGGNHQDSPQLTRGSNIERHDGWSPPRQDGEADVLPTEPPITAPLRPHLATDAERRPRHVTKRRAPPTPCAPMAEASTQGTTRNTSPPSTQEADPPSRSPLALASETPVQWAKCTPRRAADTERPTEHAQSLRPIAPSPGVPPEVYGSADCLPEVCGSADCLPEVCRRHVSRVGCQEAGCCRLHLCHFFLADICEFDDACCFGHSLTTEHNQVVCKRFGLDASRELICLQKLRLAFEDSGWFSKDTYLSHLEVCFKFSSKNPCVEHVCNRIHVCRGFVAGACRQSACRFGHDLHSSHNESVLVRHRATQLSDEAILAVLRQTSEAGGRQDAAAAAPAAGLSQRVAAASGQQQQQQQPSGLIDELKCPVCLEFLHRATTLGCGHTFCARCLVDVRRNTAKCPMCRKRITSSIRSVTLDNVIRNIRAMT